MGAGTQASSTAVADETDEALDVCRDALRWARDRDYAGWDPYDGLNSPLLSGICTNWFTRLVGMHGVHKFPLNLRPLLGVPKERNPKGIGLFAMAYLDLYDEFGDESDRREAERLLDWLVDNRSDGFDRSCWGYNFDWQNARQFYLPAYRPASVPTVFCGRAFLQHARETGSERSREVALGTAEFLVRELNEIVVTVDGESHRVYAYTPYDSHVVINVNALVANYLASVGEVVGRSDLVDRARELVDFVVDAQDGKGAWYYAMPASDSHLSHDNFHTGYVLESLRGFLSVCPDATHAHEAYETGLAFYRENLFEPDGAPKFESDSAYPRDVHGAAQAIRTLAIDGDERSFELAQSVLEWTLENLFDEEGYFYRRRGRLLDDLTPYMRWNQAWMCFALSCYLRQTGDE